MARRRVRICNGNYAPRVERLMRPLIARAAGKFAHVKFAISLGREYSDDPGAEQRHEQPREDLKASFMRQFIHCSPFTIRHSSLWAPCPNQSSSDIPDAAFSCGPHFAAKPNGSRRCTNRPSDERAGEIRREPA